MSKGQFQVSIQPTDEQISAGIKQLLEDAPSLEDMEEDELSDLVVFVWQAMVAAR